MTREFKTNFDGAMFLRAMKCGITVVIRNASGQIIAALSEKSPKASISGKLRDDGSKACCKTGPRSRLTTIPF